MLRLLTPPLVTGASRAREWCQTRYLSGGPCVLALPGPLQQCRHLSGGPPGYRVLAPFLSGEEERRPCPDKPLPSDEYHHLEQRCSCPHAHVYADLPFLHDNILWSNKVIPYRARKIPKDTPDA